jgi:hypothetical protein
MRNDALNFDTVLLKQGQKFFLTGRAGDLFENILGFHLHSISGAWQALCSVT